VFIAELFVTMCIHFLINTFIRRKRFDFYPYRCECFVALLLVLNKHVCSRTFMGIYIFSYTSVANACISFFQCIDVGPYKLLFSEPSIRAR